MQELNKDAIHKRGMIEEERQFYIQNEKRLVKLDFLRSF